MTRKREDKIVSIRLDRCRDGWLLSGFNYQHAIGSLQSVTILFVRRANGHRFREVNARRKVYLWVVVVLQELLKDVLAQLHQLIDVLVERAMVVGRYQVFPLLHRRHKSLHAEVHRADEVLLAVYQLDEVSLPQTVGVLLCGNRLQDIKENWVSKARS
jgi:transcriptional regulator of aromatic amino acid metabolism